MFTGIVEELGRILDIKKTSNLIDLTIEAQQVLENLVIGQSIATNGVCLTVTELGPTFFKAQLMKTTMESTNLSQLRLGDRVNLERALRLSDCLDGHLVSGHIDCLGYIKNISRLKNYYLMTISMDPYYSKYLVDKGSIAIDGISLTVVEALRDSFTVSIIPHTKQASNLDFKKTGDSLNLEFDLIPKYLEKLLKKENEMDLAFLRDKGFC